MVTSSRHYPYCWLFAFPQPSLEASEPQFEPLLLDVIQALASQSDSHSSGELLSQVFDSQCRFRIDLISNLPVDLQR